MEPERGATEATEEETKLQKGKRNYRRGNETTEENNHETE